MMRVPAETTHCRYGAHHRCVPGASLYCACPCHRTCRCSTHPSLGAGPLSADRSPETAFGGLVLATGTPAPQDNGVEIEHRLVGEAQPLGRWSP